MLVHRARTACPNCNTEDEVWYYKGTIAPIEVVQCINCDLIYEAGNYIQNLIELYQNVTVSATEVVNAINL